MAKKAARELKEWGWKTVRVWPKGEVALDDWAESDFAKGHSWRCDPAIGCVFPTDKDATYAFYSTLWCSK